jgi:hypothetical protein
MGADPKPVHTAFWRGHTECAIRNTYANAVEFAARKGFEMQGWVHGVELE